MSEAEKIQAQRQERQYMRIASFRALIVRIHIDECNFKSAQVELNRCYEDAMKSCQARLKWHSADRISGPALKALGEYYTMSRMLEDAIATYE